MINKSTKRDFGAGTLNKDGVKKIVMLHGLEKKGSNTGMCARFVNLLKSIYFFEVYFRLIFISGTIQIRYLYKKGSHNSIL